MSLPTTTTTLPAAPPGTPALGSEARLAPPLPAPPPDPRLFSAALLLLAVALALVWRARARMRRQQPSGSECRQTLLRELGRIKTQGTCPCRLDAAAAGAAARGQRPCANRVYELLAEFAATATGLPCSRLTTQEMRARAERLPTALQDTYARLVDTLAAADHDRFAPPQAPAGETCLVEAAIATVRNWPATPAVTPSPAGNRAVS